MRANEKSVLRLLKRELGAVELDTLDHIRERRRYGADFTQITVELNGRGFPPPPWRERWELQDTVAVYGWRR